MAVQQYNEHGKVLWPKHFLHEPPLIPTKTGIFLVKRVQKQLFLLGIQCRLQGLPTYLDCNSGSLNLPAIVNLGQGELKAAIVVHLMAFPCLKLPKKHTNPLLAVDWLVRFLYSKRERCHS